MTIKVETLDHETGQLVESKAEEDKSAQEGSNSEQKDSSETGAEEKEEKEERTDGSEESDEAKDEAEEKSEDESEGEEDDKEPENEKPKKKGGFQRRVDKLTRKISEKDTEIEYWKREALKKGATESKEGEEVEPKAESKETDPGKPRAEDFDDHSEYVEALAEYKADQKIKDYASKQEQKRIQSEQQAKVNSHIQRVQEFSEKVDDFQEVLEGVDDIQASATVQEVIITSENGAELMYELAKDRAEYARICNLTPIAAARALGRFESKISSRSSQEKVEPKKITKAPKPLTPVGSKGGKAEKSIYDAGSMTQKEYEALRAKQRSG